MVQTFTVGRFRPTLNTLRPVAHRAVAREFRHPSQINQEGRREPARLEIAPLFASLNPCGSALNDRRAQFNDDPANSLDEQPIFPELAIGEVPAARKRSSARRAIDTIRLHLMRFGHAEGIECFVELVFGKNVLLQTQLSNRLARFEGFLGQIGRLLVADIGIEAGDHRQALLDR